MTAYLYGVQQPVAGSNPLTVTVGSDAYVLIGASADATNVSTTPGGISGVLTFSSSISVSDGTAGNTAKAATASLILRPNARTNTSQLQVGETLAMTNVLDAVAGLRLNAVPDIDGAYNCYLDPISARQLFADPDFQ